MANIFSLSVILCANDALRAPIDCLIVMLSLLWYNLEIIAASFVSYQRKISRHIRQKKHRFNNLEANKLKWGVRREHSAGGAETYFPLHSVIKFTFILVAWRSRAREQQTKEAFARLFPVLTRERKESRDKRCLNRFGRRFYYFVDVFNAHIGSTLEQRVGWP